MISIQANIKSCRDNINTLIAQRNEINNEILRLEGSIRILKNMEQAGVNEITINKNPLETTEVIESDNVQPE